MTVTRPRAPGLVALALAALGLALAAGLAPAQEGPAPVRPVETTFAADLSLLAHAPDAAVSLEGTLLSLAAGRSDGAAETPEVAASQPFDRLCASLNAELPGTSSVEVLARVRLDDGSRTEWLSLGHVGTSSAEARLPRSVPGPKEGAARVAIDTIELAAPPASPDGKPAAPRGRAFALRVVLRRAATGEAPRIRRLSAVAWPRGSHEPEVAGAAHPAWGRVLVVPERSQCVEDPKIRGRICSATSLGMVLAYHGVALLTSEVAAGVLDHEAGIYGNWAFNVALAGRLGLRAEIGRCASFAPVEAEILAGRPVVISHRWNQGELQGSPVSSTDGHLIVIRGFTPEGDVAVNDPAADPRKGEPVGRVYRRADLERTWLGRGDGVAYFVRAYR